MAKPKQHSILVADKLSDEGMAILEAAAAVTVRTGMDETALRDALPGFQALVVRSATKVTARALEGADKLAVIGRAGIGIDNIDVPAATERGIVVMNTPDAGAVTTGELAIALLASLARKIPAADAALKAGRWDKKLFSGVELARKVFGIVGLGKIGRVVAERGLGLGMEVVAYDPFLTQDSAPTGVRMLDLNELLGLADFVSVHVPLLDETRHLLDRSRIAAMKPGARLIHAARGGIVDDEALCDALESGHLAGAALDVFEVEPLPEDHRLRRLDNVVLTPHIGASTAEASRNVAIDMAHQIAQCLQRGIVLNGINVPRIAPHEAAAVGPFLDLAHSLSAFLTQVVPGRLQSIRLTLQGGLANSAARPLTVAALVGALQHASEDPVTAVNAERLAERLGIRVHTESSSLKRDFMNLLRVEAVIDEQRHFVTGTVLGQNHGRLVEFDDQLLDAIPEPPLLVTQHRNEPGVLGKIGTALGELGINVERMQLGDGVDAVALGIWNLDTALSSTQLEQMGDLDVIEEIHQVTV